MVLTFFKLESSALEAQLKKQSTTASTRIAPKIRQLSGSSPRNLAARHSIQVTGRAPLSGSNESRESPGLSSPGIMDPTGSGGETGVGRQLARSTTHFPIVRWPAMGGESRKIRHRHRYEHRIFATFPSGSTSPGQPPYSLGGEGHAIARRRMYYTDMVPQLEQLIRPIISIRESPPQQAPQAKFG